MPVDYIVSLSAVDLAHTRCKFPPWVVQHRHWYSLDKSRQFNFSHTNSSFKQEVREDPDLAMGSSMGTAMASMALLGHGAVGAAPPTYSTGALAAGLQGDRHQRTEMVGVCHSVEETSAQAAQAAQPNSSHERKQVKLVAHITSGW